MPTLIYCSRSQKNGSDGEDFLFGEFRIRLILIFLGILGYVIALPRLTFAGVTFDGNVFGYYSYFTDPRWIYHFDLGYEYWFDANDGPNGIFFFDFASNHFFYTSRSFSFPYLYVFSLNTVLYHFPDPQRPGHYTTNPRYFYNFATGQITAR